MTKGQVLYIVRDSKNPPPVHIQEHRQKEEVFLQEYLNKTGMMMVTMMIVMMILVTMMMLMMMVVMMR